MLWTIYWFMLPACILIASIAMLTGISGTALLTPFIILVFPFLHVPILTTYAAISMSLLTEFFGFGSGMLGYWKTGLIDFRTGKSLVMVTIPAIIIFSLLASSVNSIILKIIYGVMMVGLALYLLATSHKNIRDRSVDKLPAEVIDSPIITREKENTIIRTSYGKKYVYRVCNATVGRIFAFAGASMEGLTSVGLGELVMPSLIRNCKMPVAVSAGTSVFVIGTTVFFGSIISMLSLASHSGISNIPWNLVVYTIPGAIIGGAIGSRFQGKFSSKFVEKFISITFMLVGIAFLYTTLPQLLT